MENIKMIKYIPFGEMIHVWNILILGAIATLLMYKELNERG